MNVLFIRNYPLVDGTFTLLIRLARKLSSEGHNTFFLFFKNEVDKDLLNQLMQTSSVFYLDHLQRLKKEGLLPTIDVIHGIVSGESLYITYAEVKQWYFQNASVVLGVYHPRAYFTKTIIGLTPDTYINKVFFKKIPSTNVLFMNESVKRAHEGFFGLGATNSPVIPLLVEVGRTMPERRSVKRNKIVSVGRLVEFKGYVKSVISTVIELNKRGYSFEYHIYGDGPLFSAVEQMIASSGFSSFIYLHGSLSYGDFNNAVIDAGVFIGMGTAIIESSALGVPSILAVESMDEYTYGWFSDLSGFEVGEQIPGNAVFSFEEFIVEAFNADNESYWSLCVNHWRKARRFSSDLVIGKYYDFLAKADPNFIFVLPRWRRLVIKAARQLFKLKWLYKKGYKHK